MVLSIIWCWSCSHYNLFMMTLPFLLDFNWGKSCLRIRRSWTLLIRIFFLCLLHRGLLCVNMFCLTFDFISILSHVIKPYQNVNGIAIMFGVVSSNECQLLSCAYAGLVLILKFIDKEFFWLPTAGVISMLIFFLVFFRWWLPKNWEWAPNIFTKFLFRDKSTSSTCCWRRIIGCFCWFASTDWSKLSKALKSWRECRQILSNLSS